MKKFYLVLFLTLFCAVPFFAQPIIWTIDGDSIATLEVELFQDTSMSIRYKNLCKRWLDIDRQDIFSIQYNEDNVQFLYRAEQEDDLTIAQMQRFIAGCRDGATKSKTAPFTAGFISGLMALTTPPDLLYLAPLLPLTTVIVIGRYSGLTLKYSYDENYVAGYSLKRKKNAIKASIYGSILGLGLGSVGSFLVYGWGLK